MAQLPSIEESEQFILNICRKRGMRPGDVLRVKDLYMSLQGQNKFRAEDLIKGMESLVQKEFFEPKDRDYALTEKGYQAL
jgi:hypothetical protein